MIQGGEEAFPLCSHKGEATFITTSLSSKHGCCCHTPDRAAAQNSRKQKILRLLTQTQTKMAFICSMWPKNCRRQKGD